MPNHETNTVVVVGAPENVEKFRAEAFTDDKIDFELITPPPANIEKGGCSGHHEDGVVCWYTWNLQNWGTKWNAYHHGDVTYGKYKGYLGDEEDDEDEEVVYGRLDFVFETAWSQPTPIFEKIEERWGVQVHAVTQDEGGFPDVEYGDPYGREYLEREVRIAPRHWDSMVKD